LKGGREMSRKRFTPERIIGKMIEAKIIQAGIKTIYPEGVQAIPPSSGGRTRRTSLRLLSAIN
jgi:hypothetical protein